MPTDGAEFLTATWMYDVVGFHGGDHGLAIAARQTVEALKASGRRLRLIGLETRPRSFLERFAPATRDNEHAEEGQTIALFHANPHDIAQQAFRWMPKIDFRARNACVPFWELPLVPESWETMLSAMDAVLAPSQFIQEACAQVVGPNRVLHYPQATELPPGVRRERKKWGLSPTATVFLVSFDVGSDIERKNPWATVEAFRRAFPGSEDVQLVIKTRVWGPGQEFAGHLQRLRENIAGDRRILVVEKSLPYVDVMGLYASCDALVSLHRSEGLGLHLMEAMSLGKAVVATGWSGNLDFMTAANSVLVGYTLVALESRHPEYLFENHRPGQVWAEPDVDAAARSLRQLFEMPAWREQLGREAARDMQNRRAAGRSGTAFSALEELLSRERHRPVELAVSRTRRHLFLRGLRQLAGL